MTKEDLYLELQVSDNSWMGETHKIDSPAVWGEFGWTLLGLCTLTVCNIFSSPVIYYCEAFMKDRGFFCGGGGGYFSLNWLKCVSASLWNDSSLVCRDATKPRRPNVWTTGAARRVFRLVSLPWFLLFIRPNIDFNSRGGGGGGGSATFEGWMVCGLQSLISFIYIFFFIAYKEKHCIITQHNTPLLSDELWVICLLGTIKPKVRLTSPFFSCRVDIFARWHQHSTCK